MAPTTYQDAGLSLDLLIQLALKTLHFSGEMTGGQLAGRLGLNFSVIEPALDFLKAQRQVEIAGGTMVGRASYRYRITDSGRVRAALFLETNQYVGVAPVPFEQYRRYMTEFQKAAPAYGHSRPRARRVRDISSSASTCSISWARPSTRATRCSSTALRETARRSFRRPCASCSAAPSRSHTRSRSRAPSSACSIRSTTNRSCHRTTIRIRGWISDCVRIVAGSCAGDRWSWSEAN